MDEQLQSILDQALKPQPDEATQIADGPLSDILQQAGITKPTPTPTQSSSDTSDWGQFTQKAQNIVSERKLPPAMLKVLLSQAALESGRGTAAPGNNYFGIKGQGTEGSNNLATQEYGNGGYYGENSDFAAYKTPEDSINAYLDLVQGYQGVPEAIQSNNPDTIIRAIEANGYATSPTYVQEIENMPEFNQ